MTLADYVEAAILGEGAKRPNDVPQSYASKDEIIIGISHLLEGNITDEILSEVLDRLVRYEVAEVIKDNLAGDFFRLNHDKIVRKYSESALDPTSLVFKYGSIGPSFLRSAINHFSKDSELSEPLPLEQPVGEVPASDRIVRLDDNSTARDEILGRLEELAAAVRGHNDEDGKLGEDRERVVAELRAGQELLKAPSVRVRAIWTLLGGALAFIASEFAGSVIGELAGLLMEALKPLLGI